MLQTVKDACKFDPKAIDFALKPKSIVSIDNFYIFHIDLFRRLHFEEIEVISERCRI